MRLLSRLCPLLVAALLGACSNEVAYHPVDRPAQLQVSFADPQWDGLSVPVGQRCRWAGGNGSTPPLRVAGIPPGANALLVAFSDRSYFLMDHGGHGELGLWLHDAPTSVSIPAVAGESLALPDGMFVERRHQGWLRGHGGAYLPPCSGGRGHHYYATLRAVYKAADGGESRLLGEGRIELGEY